MKVKVRDKVVSSVQNGPTPCPRLHVSASSSRKATARAARPRARRIAHDSVVGWIPLGVTQHAGLG
jgi:hypothetical protein